MYKPPQDIITELLKEDVGVNLKQRLKSIKVNIDEPVSIETKPQVSVNVVNPNRRNHKFSINMREALNGDLMFMDHKDIDIILMKDKKKIVAFPKDLMSEVVYGAESRLMEHLRKKGIVQFDSIQGGNIYGSLEGKILESSDSNEITMSIYELNEWLMTEGGSTARKEKYTQQISDMELHPEDDLSTELGEVPHAEEKGSIVQNSMFAPYLYGRYTY
jgi:hypothetical protein